MRKLTESTDTRKPAGKNCTKCKEWKPAEGFHADKRKKSGIRAVCKDCTAEYRKKNAERAKAASRKSYLKNREKVLARGRERLANDPDLNKRYYRNAREKRLEYRRKYYKENRETILVKAKEYESRPEVRKAKRPKARARQRHREKNDVQFLIATRLRTRFYLSVCNNYRAGSAVRDLGMAIPEFRAYIESLWLPDMTWDNYGNGGWHLDHIYPLAAADLTDRAQFLAVANWQNYQPLWEADNISKKDKVTPAARRLFNRLCRQFAEDEAAA